jgi:hypothetical protein
MMHHLEILKDAISVLDGNIAKLEENLTFERYLRDRLVGILAKAFEQEQSKDKAQPESDPFDMVTGPVERTILKVLSEHPTKTNSDVAFEVRKNHPDAKTTGASVASVLRDARKDPLKRLLLPPNRR